KWDQSGYKQTVVERYGGRLRWLRPWWNLTSPLLGCPRLPEPGAPLRSFYASFIAVDDDEVNVLRALLRRLYNAQCSGGARGRYAYFLSGFHECDPLAAALSDYALTPFAGRLFVVHFADGAEAFDRLDGRVPYVELATL